MYIYIDLYIPFDSNAEGLGLKEEDSAVSSAD
jgi:hypothetical protein